MQVSKSLGAMFVAALAASIITLAGREWLTPDRASDPSATPTVEALRPHVDTDLRDALARIEAQLQEHALVAPSVPRRSVSDPIDPIETRNLAESEARLVNLLVQLEQALATSAPVSPLDRRRAVDRASIHALDALQRTDKRAAEREVHLMTVPEAIARFGYPDRTGAAHGQSYDMYWSYETLATNGGTHTQLELYFTSGLVLGFKVDCSH